MKNTILGFVWGVVITIGIGYSSSVQAQSIAYGTVTSVIENWTYETRRVPFENCTTVRVPITGSYYNGYTRLNQQSNAGDVLGGMIIGGLVGKGATGNDRGAALGAVIGGLIGADRNNQRVVRNGYPGGYTNQVRCVTDYDYINESVQAGYIVQYMYEGYMYQFQTFKNYNIGDKIRLNLQVHPIN